LFNKREFIPKIITILLFLMLINLIINYYYQDSYLFWKLTHLFVSPQREFYYTEFIANFDKLQLFGNGLGNSADFWNISERIYPHNIFIQTFVEIGAFGILVLIYMYFISFYRIYIITTKNKILRDYSRFCLYSIIVLSIDASTGGSLADCRDLWFILMLSTTLPTSGRYKAH
jgi:cell division protein FtsW (lipid II flippase)